MKFLRVMSEGVIGRPVTGGLEYECYCGRAAVLGRNGEGEDEARLVIPDKVSFGGGEFEVSILRKEAFSKSLLKSVSIGRHVLVLPEKCFEFCEALEEVVFRSESCIQVLGKSCFKCTRLQEIEIPNTVVKIGKKCFDRCASLCSVVIGKESQLVKIGSCAFRGCQVRDMYVPSTLDISKSKAAFIGVKSIVPSKDCRIKIVENSIIKGSRKMVHCFSVKSTFIA